MDTYSKVVLTIIAVALCAIAFNLFIPQLISTRSFAGMPTRGDLSALRDISDGEQRKQALLRLMRNVPLIWVQGGDIDAEVTGTVSVER